MTGSLGGSGPDGSIAASVFRFDLRKRLRRQRSLGRLGQFCSVGQFRRLGFLGGLGQQRFRRRQLCSVGQFGRLGFLGGLG